MPPGPLIEPTPVPKSLGGNSLELDIDCTRVDPWPIPDVLEVTPKEDLLF